MRLPANWRLLAKGQERLELSIYDDIGSNPDGSGLTAKAVLSQISAAPKSKSTLVRINSAGGVVTEGMAIYNILNQRENVTTRVDSLAGSISSIIFMAGERREMAEHSMLMIHNPFGLVEGDAAELRDTADTLDKMRDQMLGIYCAKTGLPRAVVERLCNSEKWMDAQEALQLGFATHIIPDDKSARLAARFDLSAFQNVPQRAKDIAEAAAPKRVLPPLSRTVTVSLDAFKAALGESLEKALAGEDVTLGDANADDEVTTKINLGNGASESPDAEKSAPSGEPKMAMTAEETQKMADLEAAVADLKAKLTTEATARASAEEALAKAKTKASDEEDDEEDQEDMEAKAEVIAEAKALTGCADIRKLAGALVGYGTRTRGAGAKDAHKARVERLIAEGKVPPHLKPKALTWTPAKLDGFIEMTGGEKFAPLNEEHTPDDNADGVVKARAAAKPPEFDESTVKLDAAELTVVKQMGASDAALADRMLAEKKTRLRAEHTKKFSASA